MKKALLVTAICGMMVAGTAFSQPSAQLSFSGPGTVGQNGTFTLNTTLTYSDFQSYGLSYWLEIPNAPASFFHITAETCHKPSPRWLDEFGASTLLA